MTVSDTEPASHKPSHSWRVTSPRADWLKALLRYTNPHCDVGDRDIVLRAVHHATGGSASGLAMADDWCQRGSDYCGTEALTITWQRLRHHQVEFHGFAVLSGIVEAHGFDWIDICSQTEPDFEHCEYNIIHADEQTSVTSNAPINALAKYSLRGRRSEVANTVVDQVHVLGKLALSSQLTAIYGAPGTGKSLIAMALITDAITQGHINAGDIYYLDFDTNPNGLLEKIDVADVYGFNVLSDGYLEFSSRQFLVALDEIIDHGQATGTLVVLDTLKKFVSIMDKERSSSFANRLRRLSKAGGAYVALAHVNKHRASDGKPIYAGTSDILEDFDCAFLMYEVAVDADAQTKTIMFENIKARGNVAKRASYRYSISEGLTYSELLDSVVAVEEAELSEIQHAEQFQADASVIEAISACIRDGNAIKMSLAAAAAKSANVSRRRVLEVLDRYCGTDPDVHRWNYTVHERGAKKYELLINSKAAGSSHS